MSLIKDIWTHITREYVWLTTDFWNKTNAVNTMLWLYIKRLKILSSFLKPSFILLRSDLFEVQIYSIHLPILKQSIHCSVTVTPKTSSNNKLNSQTTINKKHYNTSFEDIYLRVTFHCHHYDMTLSWTYGIYKKYKRYKNVINVSDFCH